MESMIEPEAEAEARNWLELPAEVTFTILLKLGAIEILTSAQNVCTLWRKICKDPLMWRVIDMHNWGDFGDILDYDLEIMCRHAVDRSCGQLVDINIVFFGTDALLQYITQSPNQLRRLRITDCQDISDQGLNEAISKLPLLEHLELSISSFEVETLKRVGRRCPHLKSLKLSKPFCRLKEMISNEDALAIAESMPKLHQLELYGNGLTNTGLQAILDGCPDLESLDLRKCFNLKLAGQMGEKCAERIKTLHLPHDPVHDDEFITESCYSHDCGSEDEEYISSFPEEEDGFCDYSLNYEDYIEDDFDYRLDYGVGFGNCDFLGDEEEFSDYDEFPGWYF